MSSTVKIDFFVAGFSKCGTTSLCAALAMHPDIFVPETKEPRYFSSDRFDERHRAFEKMYAPAAAGQKLCDGSPVYSSAARVEVAIPRIRENNPQARFIFIARHPRKRIESYYREMHHSGATFGVRPPFALTEFLTNHPGAIENAVYVDRLQRFITEFGDDAILPVFLEDFQANSRAVTQACCAHIGVDPEKLPAQNPVQLNVGSEKLHDTRILRWLMKNPRLRYAIASKSPERQDEVLRRLRLRVPFGNRPVPWDEPAEAIYRERVVPKALEYLQVCGKPRDFWRL
ncbi:MAG: hypothetical protein Hals2KO_16240 [Halioglobus sp.]